MTAIGVEDNVALPLQFAARDFVATREGLYFAVVANCVEKGRVPAALRYRHDGRQFHKLDSEAAQRLLKEDYSEYLYHSTLRDGDLHGVPLSRIERQFVPQRRAQNLLQRPHRQRIEQIAGDFLQLLIARGIRDECLGVTGSLLIGAHSADSDIDVVINDRDQFHAARTIVRQLLTESRPASLTEDKWRMAWLRRGGPLSFPEYVWHERRKFNKLCRENVKIDLSLALRGHEAPTEPRRKLGCVEFQADVVEDTQAFDYPAVWGIDSEFAPRVVCWTPTYTGQAFRGERIRVRGWLEEAQCGVRQVVVGTSREAVGELIAVVRKHVAPGREIPCFAERDGCQSADPAA